MTGRERYVRGVSARPLLLSFLTTLAACLDIDTCPTATLAGLGEVVVLDGRSGERICDAVVILKSAQESRALRAHADAAGRCSYAVEYGSSSKEGPVDFLVQRTGYVGAVVPFDPPFDACGPRQFEATVKLLRAP